MALLGDVPHAVLAQTQRFVDSALTFRRMDHQQGLGRLKWSLAFFRDACAGCSSDRGPALKCRRAPKALDHRGPDSSKPAKPVSKPQDSPPRSMIRVRLLNISESQIHRIPRAMSQRSGDSSHLHGGYPRIRSFFEFRVHFVDHLGAVQGGNSGLLNSRQCPPSSTSTQSVTVFGPYSDPFKSLVRF